VRAGVIRVSTGEGGARQPSGFGAEVPTPALAALMDQLSKGLRKARKRLEAEIPAATPQTAPARPQAPQTRPVVPPAQPKDGWWERSACKDVDPDVFFADEVKGRYATAGIICDSCPVTTECLAEALKAESCGVRYGMYGGLTPSERQRLAGPKPLPTKPCGTRAAYARGCRCDLCRKASSVYERDHRRKKERW
jgi:WhiB family redox-sensing transcriptional regulator